MKHRISSFLVGIMFVAATYQIGCNTGTLKPSATIPIGENIQLRDQSFEKPLTLNWTVKVSVVGGQLSITTVRGTAPLTQRWVIYSRQDSSAQKGMGSSGMLMNKAMAAPQTDGLPPPDCKPDCIDTEVPGYGVVPIRWVEIPLDGANGQVVVCVQVVCDEGDK